MSSNQPAQDGGGGGEAAPAVAPPESEQQQNPGDAQLLVSEFPPPPYYYTEADNLTPPPIPVEALALGTRKAAAAAARARDEAERLRLEEAGIGDTTHNTFLAGSTSKAEEEEEGDVVAVFGEIVEVRIFEKFGCLWIVEEHSLNVLKNSRIITKPKGSIDSGTIRSM